MTLRDVLRALYPYFNPVLYFFTPPRASPLFHGSLSLSLSLLGALARVFQEFLRNALRQVTLMLLHSSCDRMK